MQDVSLRRQGDVPEHAPLQTAHQVPCAVVQPVGAIALVHPIGPCPGPLITGRARAFARLSQCPQRRSLLVPDSPRKSGAAVTHWIGSTTDCDIQQDSPHTPASPVVSRRTSTLSTRGTHAQVQVQEQQAESITAADSARPCAVRGGSRDGAAEHGDGERCAGRVEALSRRGQRSGDRRTQNGSRRSPLRLAVCGARDGQEVSRRSRPRPPAWARPTVGGRFFSASRRDCNCQR